MTPEAKDVWMAALPAIGTLLGTALGVAGTLLLNRQTQRAEEKKQTQALAFTSGLENWKQAVEFAKSQGSGEIIPLDFFILNMVWLGHLLSENELTEEKMRSHLIEKNRVMDRLVALQKEIEAEDAKKTQTDRTTARTVPLTRGGSTSG